MELTSGKIYELKEDTEVTVFFDCTAALVSSVFDVNKGKRFKFVQSQWMGHEFRPTGFGHPNYTKGYNAHFWGVLFKDEQLQRLKPADID